jgi:hypothetical protein
MNFNENNQEHFQANSGFYSANIRIGRHLHRLSSNAHKNLQRLLPSSKSVLGQKAQPEVSQKHTYIHNHSIFLMNSNYIEVTHNLFRRFYK